MNDATLHAATGAPGRANLVPKFFATSLIVTPPENPVYTPESLADLLSSMREHSQLVPGFVCPSDGLPDGQRLCLEGNRRLAVARMLGIDFWGFDVGHCVSEAERIVLTFNHNATRRTMSRDEICERAARYMELTNCTAGQAAKVLSISGATLSRAFGEKRILPSLRERAALLGLSIRSAIAACPAALQERALAFAETPSAEGKLPTRDQVIGFITQLKRGEQASTKPRAVTLRQNGRIVTLEVGDDDNVTSVVKDLNAIISTLNRHAAVPPDGWSFLFLK